VTRLAEAANKAEAEPSPYKPHSEAKSAKPLKKSETATLKLAPSTVYCQLGPNGPFVMSLVEEESKAELDLLKWPPLSEAKYVKPPLNNKNATPNHAQLTVNYLNGLLGALAVNHVEVESPTENEELLLIPNSEVKNVMSYNKTEFATLNHAQSTVLLELGLNGMYAQ